MTGQPFKENHMTAIPETRDIPHRLLLATDLSARCDRALDRAAQLAEEWQAELVALNVLDPAASPDQALAWISGESDEQLLRWGGSCWVRPWKTWHARYPKSCW